MASVTLNISELQIKRQTASLEKLNRGHRESARERNILK